MDRDWSAVAGFPAAVLARLPERLRPGLESVRAAGWEEIRLAVGRPLTLAGVAGDRFLALDGSLVSRSDHAYRVTSDDVRDALQLMTRGSIYALEEEFRRGYLSLPGGHRVGMAGRAVLENGSVRTIRDVAGLNIRVAREVRGAANGLVPFVVGREGVRSTLLLAPPRGGKTTVLRDLVRQISDGGWRVGLVDERSELAGSVEGVPQLDVGIRTDVLDGCPKAEGVAMLLRAMGPQVVACDEIGGEAEAAILGDAGNAGVRVLATAHAAGLAEATERAVLGAILRSGVFDRVAVLSRRRGPGTLEEVRDGAGTVISRQMAG